MTCCRSRRCQVVEIHCCPLFCWPHNPKAEGSNPPLAIQPSYLRCGCNLCFQPPGDKKHLELVLGLITAERECCRFLTFNLHAAPDQGPLSLQISGPSGTKEFLNSLQGLSQSRERS
jgi:hypothetical protein